MCFDALVGEYSNTPEEVRMADGEMTELSLWCSDFGKSRCSRNEEGLVLKVRPSVKAICEKCKIIKRKGVVRVICTTPKHKQRQG